MTDEKTIQLTLEYLSFAVLGALVLFQLLHFVMAGWRFWKESPWRIVRTLAVGAFWVFYGLFFVITVTGIPSYKEAVPYVLCGLYAPSLLAIVLLILSQKFRKFVDRMSLRWTIQSVEGPARMIVGILFLFWFFAGRLPGVVAWVAGPGDWIAGFIAFHAVRRLHIFKDVAGIGNQHWSISDFRKGIQGKSFSPYKDRMKRHLNLAIAFVGFGILDFILAPASTALSIMLGEVPEEMGRLPLTLIPLVLVPQVLLLEVFAMHQLIGFKRLLQTNEIK
ncbi:hypothetical protein FK220_018905 [Flavobacteriaceae bacterium TP-CH-4]|uniref:Uncharacterized protein n=1 Tax=Pelagihabitans pacificus TaxID=2696054 RepID=A0A967AY38_9FLAO|nr:hypothetical protein [Pelagihabitans pacificus]NHF61430.1 hypothetical protein [Pelagihabitans pacificus]